MKKLFLNNYLFIILSAFWVIILTVSYKFAGHIPLNTRFLGPEPWANFDGAHYLLISNKGYGLYEQAYFPLFPLLIYLVRFFLGTRILAGYLIVYISLILNILFFILLARFDLPKKNVPWALIFFLLFPTSFFFAAMYTESLFLTLTLASFYAMRKKRIFLSFLLAGLASATRIVGIFLIPALIIEYLLLVKKITPKIIIKSLFLSLLGASGLIGYMIFLWEKYHDPLLFFHVQSAFGANRSTGTIVLLPQVIIRYIKIFLSVPFNTFTFWIALLEISTFSFIFILLLANWKKIRLSYFIFSLGAILLPTLTGTLSSMPRYVLVAFPAFFILAEIKNIWIKTTLALVFAILLSILTAFFLRGYFVA